MSYNFDKRFQGGKYTIQIDTKAMYGYFEHDELGDERAGGLWFEPDGTGDDTLALVDYDGVCCLPAPVAVALRANGYIVEEDFE